jgi:hypothetical protein
MRKTLGVTAADSLRIYARVYSKFYLYMLLFSHVIRLTAAAAAPCPLPLHCVCVGCLYARSRCLQMTPYALQRKGRPRRSPRSRGAL